MFVFDIRAGLHLNSVRAFKNGCSCSVFFSAFNAEHVRVSGVGLNMFGIGLIDCSVRCSDFFVHVLFGVRNEHFAATGRLAGLAGLGGCLAGCLAGWLAGERVDE